MNRSEYEHVNEEGCEEALVPPARKQLWVPRPFLLIGCSSLLILVVVCMHVNGGGQTETAVTTDGSLRHSLLQELDRNNFFYHNCVHPHDCCTPNLAKAKKLWAAEEQIQFADPPACAMAAFDYGGLPTAEATEAATSMLGVDAVFVLHYAKLTERRKILEAWFAKQGLTQTVTWIDMPLYPDIEKKNLLHCLIKQTGNLIGRSVGTKDLSLRHLLAYHLIHQKQLKNAIVMEDDPQFAPNFHLRSVLPALLRNLPKSYLMVMVGNYHANITRHACTLRTEAMVDTKRPLHDSETKTMVNNTFVTDNVQYQLIGPGFTHRSAGGYLISLHGAQVMLRHVFQRTGGLDDAADWVMNGVIDAGTYWVEPNLWMQSEIGGNTRIHKK